MARECFLDEIAGATGSDPVDFRLALLAADDGADEAQKSRRLRLAAVIRLAAENSGWGGPLAAGRARGIAAHIYDGETTLAQVAEVSIERGPARTASSARSTAAVINPLGLEAQVESAVVWGLCQVLGGQITFRGGRVQETNFANCPILRYSETPVIETHSIAGSPQPLGAGEQPVAPVAAAVLNALSTLTGKRLRRLPVSAGDLG
jgi:isoquinoline 1-oxidoreductase beta subunit